jgi:hypothetical protein
VTQILCYASVLLAAFGLFKFILWTCRTNPVLWLCTACHAPICEKASRHAYHMGDEHYCGACKARFFARIEEELEEERR